MTAGHYHAARAIRDQQAEQRCITSTELELLRVALMHWRFKLTNRMGKGLETQQSIDAHKELLARHHAVLTEK